MMKHLALLAATLMLVSATGCADEVLPSLPAGDDTAADQAAPAGTDSAETGEAAAPVEAVIQQDCINPNFLLLISDEKNDIGDFSELLVTISAFGFVQGDEEGIVEYELDEVVTVDLVKLTGENAVALWEGYVPEDTYEKVFLYVDEAWGVSSDPEEEEIIEVKLPSGKLQVSAPVTIVEGEDTTVEYVFDLTVHKAGNSGMYILSPQLSESGAGVAYRLVQHTEAHVRIGQPEWSGKPDDAGQPSHAGPDDGATPPKWGQADDTGKPSDGGRRSEANKPDDAG